MRPQRLVTAGLIFFACTARAQAPESHGHSATHGLGVVSFVNSGAPAAQAPFLRGLALLHSFEYDEAGEAFREAQRADSTFALAYYGEALTYAHIVWGEDDTASARGALRRLGASAAARVKRARTARERAYAGAVEALFVDAPLPVRVRGFADSTRALAERHPRDVDAIAFASLGQIMAWYDGELPPAARDRARIAGIELANRAFRQSPRHPGATHYLIHAADDPAYAARGLEAARAYARTAPEAEHALHMPSHIFLQLGLWDEVAATNERAWAASRAEVVARRLSPAELSFHALSWLHYAYLEQGRYGAAAALIDTARAVLNGVDLASGQHVDARFVIPTLTFMQAAHTGTWSASVCDLAHDFDFDASFTSERERSFRNTAAYQAVVAASLCGREVDSALVDAARQRVRLAMEDDPLLRSLRLALAHADAMRAMKTGGWAAAVTLLQDEHLVPQTAPVGPPYVLRTQELLGEALLGSGRAPEAVRAYDRALELTPLRSSALFGLARARAAAGDSAGSRQAYAQLLRNWQHADQGIAGLDEASRAIASH